MDESRRDDEQAPEEETPRPVKPKTRRRGGTPMQPVERAVTTPPERR